MIRPVALLALAACTSTPDLTPNRSEPAEGTVSFEVVRTSRIVVGSIGGTARIEGTRALTVSAGSFGADPITVTERALAFTASREGAMDHQTVHWTKGDAGEPPETVLGFVPFADVERTVTFDASGDVTVLEPPDLPYFEGGAEMWFEALAHAPDKTPVGTTWSMPLTRGPLGEPLDEPRTRQWTVESIEDGVAMVKSVDLDAAGDAGESQRQARSDLTVDVATGLPIRLRRRDLSRLAVASDVTATFEWGTDE